MPKGKEKENLDSEGGLVDLIKVTSVNNIITPLSQHLLFLIHN